MSLEIWHNPRCSKSRQTLGLLEDRGLEPTIIKYLDTPPTAERIREVLGLLEMEPRQLMRRKEAVYKELGLGDESLSDEALIQAMSENPKLIERPVVICDAAAALGRPPEAVLDIL